VPTAVHEVLASPAQQLDRRTRAVAEPLLGHDFSTVRVHSDERAAKSARAVDARAYTVGDHIVFSAGAFAPHTREGMALLTHELVHTVQQGGSRRDGTVLELGDPADAWEREAELVASQATGVAAATVGSRVPAVQRQLSSRPAVVSSRDPKWLTDEQLVAEYRGVLAANDPALSGYLLVLEAELALRVQGEIRRAAARRGTPVAEAGVAGPAAIALALRLLLGPGTAAGVGGGAATTVTTVTTQAVGAAGAGTTLSGAAGAAAAELAPTAVAQTAAATAERGILAELADAAGVALSAAEVATLAAIAIVLYPGTAHAPGPVERPRDEEERRQRDRCRTRFPQATPIHWPPPIWRTIYLTGATGLADPGSQCGDYDYPDEPLLTLVDNRLWDGTRPENDRYRTRVTNPPFRIAIPGGYHVHHKIPPALQGLGSLPPPPGQLSSGRVSERPEGEFTPEGRITFCPNLVLLPARVHAEWHAFLAGQPLGPMRGAGPGSPTRKLGDQFCVLERV
jgi:hypothetical protein